MSESRPFRSPLPSPVEFERVIRALCQDALAIYPMYRRLHALGLEPRRGDTVHVSGGDASPTESLAVESDYAAQRREYARWVAREINRAAKALDRVRRGLEQNVGPTAGYRQAQTIGPDAIITLSELSESQHNQAERLKAGSE